MPSTGSRSWRSRSAQTVPPCASVWWTARSRPWSLSSIATPSSGQDPPSAATRPHFGHSQARWSAPSWKSSSSTRPSEAASSVCAQSGPAPAADLAVEQLGHLAQVVLDQLLDVPLVARLRPAPLVVAAWLLVEAFLELLEPAVREPIEVTAFTADEGDQDAFPAADERNERRKVERPPDLDDVGDALTQGEWPPDA